LTVSIKQKVGTLRKLDGGMPVKRLTDEFGVGVTTIYNTRKQKNSY